MIPYYSDQHVTLYHGDWRENIPEGFRADLIVTDPPYGETGLVWDIWPTGWPQLAAKFAPSMWCFGSMRMFLRKRDEFASWKFSQDLVWSKDRGSGIAIDRFYRSHEHMLFWYQGPWSSIYHDPPRVSIGQPRRGPVHRPRHDTSWNVPKGETRWADDGTRLQLSVIEAKNMWKRSINPTEKPVSILEPLIAYGCPKGGTVLDLFAGSGSTAVAARNLGRNAVLYEAREEQCETTALRLSQLVLGGEQK